MNHTLEFYPLVWVRLTRMSSVNATDLVCLSTTDPAQPRLPVTTKAVVGAPVDVVRSFTANPRPLRVFWSLDDGQRLDVVPFAAQIGRASCRERV